MNNPEERLAYLKKLLAEDPQEAFLHYAVCLEEQKTDSQKAISSFEKLIARFPDYLPGYYQYALILAESGMTSKAQQITESGITLAQNQQDLHAVSELKGLRQNILAGEFD
jgi:tetratricopeptide (TPR) repeat protein